MCLILFGYQSHPRYPLVMVANRDEFYARPTAAAAFWNDAPAVLAGRDLVQGGAWLGVTRDGRLAALTNYREPGAFRPDAPSRGHLVSDFLTSGVEPERYLEKVRREGELYNGFSLLVSTVRGLYCYCNRTDGAISVSPGIHGLSNHLLDTPWPKVVRAKEALAQALAAQEVEIEELFAILADDAVAPDESLPATGVSLEWERILSASFIKSTAYGTRSSTVIVIDRDGEVLFEERSFNGGKEPGIVRERFMVRAR